jgi:flagellar assembly protein FliH
MSDKDFSFEVSEYDFMTFQGSKEFKKGERLVTKEFSLGDIEKAKKEITPDFKHKICEEARKADDNQFRISPIVREQRGLAKQESVERDNRIQIDVDKKVEKLRELAYKKGYEEGLNQGREDVYNQTRSQTEEKLASLTAMLSEVLGNYSNIIKNQKSQIYSLVKNLTKWILLKEIDNDEEYIERLFEKLLLELDCKSNILIKINQKDFEKMPVVLETVQKKIGELKNIRIEIDYELEGRGIILESENGIINGSLQEQFKSLDKLFSVVGLESIEGENDDLSLAENIQVTEVSEEVINEMIEEVTEDKKITDDESGESEDGE